MFRRLMMGIASRVRQTLLAVRGVKFDGNSWLRAIEVPRFCTAIQIGNGVSLDRGVTLLISEGSKTGMRLIIGPRTYVNRYSFFDASEMIHIGSDCMIGPFCYITDHDHTSDDAGRPAGGVLKSAPVTLEPNCWLGAHVTVLKGVTIGRGAVIGAGSVVTKLIPAGATAVGNPARVIKGGAC
jgi:acetyltransferase-like isoleucine patch superfamily enzyme